MFSQDRIQLRRVFIQAWQKARSNHPLEALEQVICNIVEQHPEYHAMLEDEHSLDKDFTPEMQQSNPFLHMAMHIAIHEQLVTQRPSGINEIYQELSQRLGSHHEAEHQFMECLGKALWEAQQANGMPDEQSYLECLRQL